MFDFGAVGHAILFFMATAGQVVVGSYMAGYAAHCFLVIVEDTAAGIDEIVWPDIPIVDWLGKVFYLVWLVAFWTVPAWLLAGVIVPAVADRSGLPFSFFVILAIWLFFPISLFSSLSANSRWVVFHPEVLRRIGHHLPAMLLVYLITGVFVVGWAFLAHYTMTRRFLLLPLVALTGPAVLFIDARLLGRVSWLLNHRTPGKRRTSGAKKKTPQAVTKAIAAHDPWAVPPEREAGKKPPQEKKPEPVAQKIDPIYPWDVPEEQSEFVDVEDADDADFLPVEGYGLKEDEPPPTSRIEEYEPIGLQPMADDPPATDKKKEDVLAPLLEVSPFEAALAARHQEPEPPAHPLWSGVYQFPLYPRSVGPLMWLVFGSLIVGLLLKIQIDNWLLGS
jgi:hypothetical protein